MRLYFIRHAQSVNNALWAQTGSDKGRTSDPDLTDLGMQQAERVAEFLSTGSPHGGVSCNGSRAEGFALTHLYSSLMIRAVKTGSRISRATGVPLHAWVDIHEEGGIFQWGEESGEHLGLPGYNRAYFQEHFPEFVLPESLGEAGWWGSKPLEPDEERPERARRVLEELLDRHGGTDDQVAVVSHGGFYTLFLTQVLKLSSREQVWFTMYNTGITRLDFADDRTNVVYQNRVAHLPPEMVT